MAQQQYDIFISYRREDGKDFARHMQLKLQNYGFRVFLDFDELKDGKFDRRIMDAIESAPVFMVILSPHLFDRCRDERDWVRREIEHAIMHDRHIVPVNPDRKFGGFPDDCPSSISAGLGQHQFTEIFTGQQFNTTVEDMVRIRIRPVLEETSRAPREEVGAIIHIETDIDCRVLKFGKEIGLARVGKDLVIRLRKGKHRLEYISLENASDRYSELLTIDDNDIEDILQVELANIRAARLEAERKERERKELERKEQEHKEQERKERERRLAIPDEDIDYYFEEIDKYGFKVESTGEVLIPPKYDNAWGFCEGLVAVQVKLNGKWGFIDKTGKEVIPLQYDEAWSFSEGLASVKLNGKWGYIDKAGKVVIPFKYDIADSLSEGLAAVCLNGKWGYIDKTDKVVIPLKYDDAWNFSEGLARVYLKGKCGFIDKTGKVVIPFKYDDAWNFSEGLALVKLNGEWFKIDKNGNRVY